MAKYKEQHFLPEFYLNGFTKRVKIKEGIVNNVLWLYDKEKKKIKSKSPDNIAFRNYFYSVKDEKGEYDHKIEIELSKLESDAKLLFERIDNDITKIINKDTKNLNLIYPQDKELLLTFVLIMLKRVPKVIDSIQEEFEKFALELQEKSKEHNIKVNEEFIKASTLNVFSELGVGGEMDFYNALYDKNIYFIYIHNNKTSFITTDNPVVMWRANKQPAGLRYSDTEIYFPINQRCLLGFSGQGNKIEMKQYKDRKWVYGLNRHIAFNNHKLIICKDEQLLKKLVRDMHLSLLQ